MNISFTSDSGFLVTNNKKTVALQTSEGTGAVLRTDCGTGGVAGDGRLLNLPGEFELQEILVKGIYSAGKNVVYRLSMDGMTVVHVGDLGQGGGELPKAALYEEMGESVHVAIVNVPTKWDAKKLDKFIDTLSPNMAILVADQAAVPALLAETGATTCEEDITVKKSELDPENTTMRVFVRGA